MKYPSLQDTIQQDQDFMRMAYSIDAVGGGDLLKSALEYILNTTDRAHPQQFVQRVVKAVQETMGAMIMTMAERLQAIGKEKWIQRGMEQGMAQGVRNVAIELLKQDTTVEWVAQVTKLPVAAIQDMKQTMELVDE